MRTVTHSFLQSRWLWLLARVLLAVVFVSSGLAKLIDFQGGIAEMQHAGLSPAWLFNIATIVTLLGGSALLLADKALWLGAGILAFFLILSIIIVHHFWMLPAERAMPALYIALEHMSVIGGLLAASIASHQRKIYANAIQG
ncbi:DoxX family protein [Shewanella dokdonensis]|uniref:DoxX family protein n=1 Tax=Shewanella dokdonensis TaxID=712036 RepID=A0ABX8DAW6_9GAMM|nr:DoxX family protein [Shewanella dokdonensis]MCL1075271.1 DoxX family protein [Shewanella dokdonensis]QVK21993.1 DoxX family protein [Shewanella dokdonensis]